MKNSDVNVEVTYKTHGLGKPPLWFVWGSITFTNDSPNLIYFVMPYDLGDSMITSIPDVEAVTVSKTTPNGSIYLCVYGDSDACYIFPIEPKSSLYIPEWEFSTWDKAITTTEIWAAQNILLNSITVDEWINKTGVPVDKETKEDDALLLRWRPEEPKVLSIQKVVAKFPIEMLLDEK